jgi:hypothetical protein
MAKKTSFKILLFIIVICSCKKQEIINDKQEGVLSSSGIIFLKHLNNDPDLEKIIFGMSQQLIENDFSNDFFIWHGKPLWDNAFKTKVNDNDFSFFVPTKKENIDNITTYFIAHFYNGATNFEMHRKSSIENNLFEFSDYGIKDFENERIIALFENKILKKTNIHLKLKNPNEKSQDLPTQSIATTTGNIFRKVVVQNFAPMVCVEICDDVEIWYDPDGDADPCDCSGNEIYLYTIQECQTTCTGGGGGGTGGGGTGGGGTGGGGTGGGGTGGGGTGGSNPCPNRINTTWYNIIPPSPCDPPPPPTNPPDTILNPCIFASTLGTNIYFKEMMQTLKNHSDNHNDTTEHGYTYEFTSTGPLLLDVHTGVPGKKEINIQFDYQRDGVAHNHFVNSLSIFSPDDLWSMCSVFNVGNVKNVNTFTLPLVTASGTQYVLMIENLTKFRLWAQKFTTGDFAILKDFYTWGAKIKETNSILQNEQKFLLYLIKQKAGLKLFRGNNTFTQWIPITVDENNIVITVPCP